MNPLLILVGKLILFVSRRLNLGSGSTWPGHIAMEVNSKFILQVLKKNANLKVIIVAGTNGKTTTSLMLQKIIEHSRLRVFRNEAGANLLNGIASSIIKNINLTGRLNFDVAIFEVDERNVSLALKEINPFAILLSNIFRDQLDRYGEINMVLKDWEEALSNVNSNTFLFTNGDDPALSFLTRNTKLKTYYFGVDEKHMKKDKAEHDVDFIYCPNCQTKLAYQRLSYSHMGKFNCPKCNFTNPKTETFPTLLHPFLGDYNVYNANAAALVANKAFGIPVGKVNNALKLVKPAFGRQEEISYKGRRILMLLSKNPAGFNQSIDAIRTRKKKGNILLALNDRIPDGRDVSWIWDVDFENLPTNSKLFISGDRAYDMALRIKYVSRIQNSKFKIQNYNSKVKIFKRLIDAINLSIAETKNDEMLFVLPTYSAMLEARKILLGRKLL